VAIRISRPQASEDEFLEQELDTVTRTGVTLLGAQPRPQGVVLRFEIVLASGTIVLRGEGRVVAFKPNVHQGLGGLTLRFTRLDSKSKALVDKANALREQRRPSGHPSKPPPLPIDLSPGPPPAADTSPETPPVEPSGPELTVESDASPAPPPVRARSVPPPLPPQRPASVAPPPVAPAPVARSRPPARPRTVPPPLPPQALATNGHAAPLAAPLPAPADRDALLERLRARARDIDASTVQSILQQKHRRT
jgi:hypothetical protein